jgi:hypothetical protein
MHPFARPGNNSTMPSRTGKSELRAGDRIVLDDGRRGRADEFLQTGDAYVTLDDGMHVNVAWNQISPEQGPPENVQIKGDLRWPDDFKLDGADYVATRDTWE